LNECYIRKVFTATLGIALVGLMAVSPADAASGGVEVTNETVTPFAQAGGGTWTYGDYKSGWLSQYKTVYSNYWHPTKVHGSAAQLGSRTPNRDCVYADKQSKASQTAKTKDTAYAYWNTSCKNPR
jgi:hypothetical protein